MNLVLGVDVGGSGIKGALVDVENGKMMTERFRIETPVPRKPKHVIPVVQQVVDHFDYAGPVGIGFPTVVINGRIKTDFVREKKWIGYEMGSELTNLLGRPVTVINDADAAGIAENKFGAGRDADGTVALLTLGTGIGSALFVDNQLVPNTEFGKIYLKNRKKVVERYLSNGAREKKKLSWKKWAKGLTQYINYLDWLFSPSLIILGGGVSKHHEKFVPRIKSHIPIIPAELRNEAGIIGAAMAATQSAEKTAT